MIASLAVLGILLYPMPQSVRRGSCDHIPLPHTVLYTISMVDPPLDSAALDVLNERWTRKGAWGLRLGMQHADVRFARDHTIKPQGYRINVASDSVTITSGDSDGAFYAVMTLAQMAQRNHNVWQLPCVDIVDEPKLKWRILSDDISRGPLPTMQYFKERIRTIATFKMNGYSPYMEHVYRGVGGNELAAPEDGITEQDWRDLANYARQYHVTLIPEQQTFAHMHNTLKFERYAKEADFPHGFLAIGDTMNDYLKNLVTEEIRAIGVGPFFHIGSDETSTLGEGSTASYVADHGGKTQVFADHINYWAKIVAPARVMFWDDGIEQDPSIMKLIPKSSVIINWHYGVEPSYEKYIRLVASGGFDQMVAPGANNWNEIYPDFSAALANERTFIRDGIANHVLGLFQTVWHDDGETLYESTWYPVLYAAAVAWNGDSFSPEDDKWYFASAFFGDGYEADALGDLGSIDAMLGHSTNKLFWADPFAPEAARLSDDTLSQVRLKAERVISTLTVDPPLHASTMRAMVLAARRYDALARRYQIAREVRFYYDHALKNPNDAVRDLFWCKYWFWEMRDTDEQLAALYEQAWRYESRPGHLASNLERYHLDAQRAIQRADAIDRVTYQDYLKTKTLPPLDDVIK